MKKLLLGTAFISTFLFSNNDLASKKVEEFINNNSNPDVLNFKINKGVTIDKEWTAFLVSINVKNSSKPVDEIFLIDKTNNYITQTVFDISKNSNLMNTAFEKLHIPFDKNFYSENNLVYGNSKSKNKLVVFTDPFCPACINFIGNDLSKKQQTLDKNDVAVYFYSIPVVNNPLNETLIKTLILYKLNNKKAIDFDLYNEIVANRIFSNIIDKQVLLSKFNEVFETDYKLNELESKKVVDIYNNNLNIAEKIGLKATPTVFYNELLDMSRKKYIIGE